MRIEIEPGLPMFGALYGIAVEFFMTELCADLFFLEI